VTKVEEGKGDEDLRCCNLFTVYQRRRDFQMRKKLSVCSIAFNRENQFVIVVVERDLKDDQSRAE